MNHGWQYTMLKLASRCICSLPYSAILKLSKVCSPLYAFIARKQKRRALRTIEASLHVTKQEAEEIVNRSFDYMALNILEMFYMPRLLDQSFIREQVDVYGLDYMKEAISYDKGVIVLTAHIGNWEWMGATLASFGYPTTTIVKNQPNADFTAFINEYREMVGLEVYSRDGADLIRAARAMKQKKILGFLADQDGGPQGMPVPFFERISSAVLGPATFARRFKAPVLPVFTTHREGGGHVVHILEPFFYEDTGDADYDMYLLTKKCTEITEDFIRKYPAEWLWFQYRWKTQLEEIDNWEYKMTLKERAYEKQ